VSGGLSIETDVPISGIRLSDWFHRECHVRKGHYAAQTVLKVSIRRSSSLLVLHEESNHCAAVAALIETLAKAAAQYRRIVFDPPGPPTLWFSSGLIA
jgi:hypothetical protein